MKCGIEHLRPKTITGIKNLAKDLKKRDGIQHYRALDAAARQAGFDTFSHARAVLLAEEAQP